MKLYYQVITVAITLLMVAVALKPVLNGVEKVLTNYSEFIANQVVIPV